MSTFAQAVAALTEVLGAPTDTRASAFVYEYEATITDDDNARRERFAATFARWFDGTIVASP